MPSCIYHNTHKMIAEFCRLNACDVSGTTDAAPVTAGSLCVRVLCSLIIILQERTGRTSISRDSVSLSLASCHFLSVSLATVISLLNNNRHKAISLNHQLSGMTFVRPHQAVIHQDRENPHLLIHFPAPEPPFLTHFMFESIRSRASRYRRTEYTAATLTPQMIVKKLAPS